MKTTLNTHDKTLTVNGVAYRIRYFTKDVVVLDTDKLQGEFGDEYPMHLVQTKILT